MGQTNNETRRPGLAELLGQPVITRVRFTNSLHFKLGLLGLVSLLIAIIPVSLVMYFNSHKTLSAHIQLELRSLVDAREQQLAQWIDNLTLRTITLASLPNIQRKVLELSPYVPETERSGDYETSYKHTLEFLDNFDSTDSRSTMVTLIGRDDTILVSTNHELEGQPASVIDASLSTKELQALYISPVKLDPSNIAIFDIAHPIISRTNDEVVGMVVLRIALSSLDAMFIPSEMLGTTGEMYLVSTENLMLTPSRFSGQSTVLRQTVNTLPMERVLDEKISKGQDKYTNYRGDLVLGTWSYIPKTNWILLAEITHTEAYAPIRRLWLTLLSVMIVDALVVIGIAYWMAQRINKPLNTLAQATARLAKGHLNEKINIRDRGEIGALAQSFNRMAQNLQTLMGQVAEEQDLLRTVIDHLPDSIFVKDTEGRILLCNKALARFLGVDSPVDVIGKTSAAFLPPEVLPQYTQREVEVMHSGKGRYNVETQMPTLNGEFIPVLATLIPLFDQQERVSGLIGMTRDISELKAAEAERAQLQEEIITAQRQAILELSTPIIPIVNTPQGGIIVLPLIGNLDAERAQNMMHSLLEGISEHQAKVVILDITGVPVVDTEVVGYLDKTVLAAQLKGARVILTGISDTVAETIVDLAIDWDNIETLANLRTGLLVALAHMGIKLVKLTK